MGGPAGSRSEPRRGERRPARRARAREALVGLENTLGKVALTAVPA